MTSRDREKVFRSVCRICHGGCSALLFVKNGKLVKVKPDPHSPFNRGQMCIKGLATPEIMYHPSRLLTPLKRNGDRGSNQWKEIDWDTALYEIANKLDKIRQESDPESIALGQGTGRHHYTHVIRFANSLGTPNWYEPGLANCFIPRITVSHLTYGGFVVADYYGNVIPKTILFWGHNPVITGPDGELSFPVKRALKAGSFGIAVDPRKSETAKRCKMWLPIRPGTDDALALAMAHVIINEGIYDREFVEKWTVGFGRLRDHVSNYTPQWAEAITWIPAEDIRAAAKRYALDKPSVLEWGVAIEHNPNSLQTVRALSLLRGLTGNIDIPGGDILGMNIVRPYPVMKHQLPKGMLQKRIGGQEFKLLGGFRALMPSAHIPGLFKAMRTGDPYRIRALLIFGDNPLVSVANAREVYQSLLKLDFLVVTDMFMTPTAALADYVLPAAFWPEINQTIELPFVAENAVLAQQKVVQVGLCRQDEEIMIDLARRLNLPGSDETLEGILNYRLEPLGITFEELKKKFMVFPPHEYRKFEEKGFRTPSKKVELYCKALERLGYDPLPTYREPPESPTEQPEVAKDFPYILTTGSRRLEFFHSEHRQIKSLRKKRPHPTAEIHPTTADYHGIVNGDWIYVSSPRGKIKMKAVVTEDIRKGVVNIDHGWWFPEREGPDFGVWESNANVITSNAPPYDPAFGSYQLRGLLCNIEKIMD
jgi:anaerobic selenocysteine-containing dehydrogenase